MDPINKGGLNGQGGFGVTLRKVTLAPVMPERVGPPRQMETQIGLGPSPHPHLPSPLPPRDKTAKVCVDRCNPALSLDTVNPDYQQLPARSAGGLLQWRPFIVERPSIVSLRTASLAGPVLAWAGDDRPVGDQETNALIRSALDVFLPHAGVWWLAYDAVNGSAQITIAIHDGLGNGDTSSYRKNGFVTWTMSTGTAGAAAAQLVAANANRRWLRIENIDTADTAMIGPNNTVGAANGIPLTPVGGTHSFIEFSETSPTGLYLGPIFAIRQAAADAILTMHEGTS